MNQALFSVAAAVITAVLPQTAPADPAPVVFFDIAAPDPEGQAAFYREVFGWRIAPDGRFSVPVSSPLKGVLRVEPPNLGPPTERLLYVGVADVAATLDRVVAHGGRVVYPRTPVPGVVVLGLFTDPAGNRMGLVEIRDGEAVVP